MSRIGKKPVVVPAGVTAKVDGQLVSVKGGKGQLEFLVPDEVSVAQQDNAIKVDPRGDSKRARALWGTARASVNNIVVGVTKGFEKKLEITGVGYRAAVQGKNSAARTRLFARRELSDSGGHHDRDAQAHGNHDQRDRQAAGRPDRRGDSGATRPRAL